MIKDTKDVKSERFKAQQRAYELLWENLNVWQRWCAVRLGVVPVIDSNGGKWLINPYSRVQNSFSVDEDEWYCLTSADQHIPIADCVLALKLMLEHDLEKFRELAQPLEYAPGMGPIYDFVFQMKIRNSIKGPNEQTCCASGGPILRLDDLCEYHQGLEAGFEVGTQAATMLLLEKHEFYHHVHDIVDGNRSVENLKKDGAYHGALFDPEFHSSADEDVEKAELFITLLKRLQDSKEAGSVS